MNRLEQQGIFKAKPLSWEVQEAESGAVGINMSFLVLEELEGDKWSSWAEFDEYMFWGTWWIVKKDGSVNTSAVEQLAKSLGWDGNLGSITGSPPDGPVQVTVKPDVYNGVTRYKGAWMNPGNHEGGSGNAADPVAVKGLQSRFGSLLRAAAASAKATTPKPSASPPPKAASPKPKPAPAPAPKPQQTNDEHAAARNAAGLPDHLQPGPCGHSFTNGDKQCDIAGCAGSPF